MPISISPCSRKASETHHTDRKSTRLNSSHRCISYAVFCLKKKKKNFKELTCSRTNVRAARSPLVLPSNFPNHLSIPIRTSYYNNDFFLRSRAPPSNTLFPYTFLFQ